MYSFIYYNLYRFATPPTPDGVFAVDLRWRLGLDVCQEGLQCEVACQARSGVACGAMLDRKGYHIAVCKCGGLKTYRHSRVVAAVRGILRESRATVHPCEVSVPAWRRADGTGARLDISFRTGGQQHYVDVTLRHPCAQKYLRRAAVVDGAAAAVAEQAKRTRYPAVPDAGLTAVVPFAIETFGRLGPSALDLLHEARQRVAERDHRFSSWAGGGLFQRWLSLLACARARGMFDSAMAVWGEAWPGAVTVADVVPFVSREAL